MFEGNEIEKDLGGIGKAVLDVDPKGFIKVDVAAGLPEMPGSKAGAYLHVDLIEALEVLAKRTDNGVDDNLVLMFKMAVGRT